MKIKAFHAGDGDCLLLSATNQRTGKDYNVLVDGGRKGQFREHARDEIYKLDQLDLVYVSHIDDDHISGTLVLVDDIVRWRVHERRLDTKKRTRKPRFPRPPKIKEIWHNSLFELVGEDLEPEIPGALATTTRLLLARSPTRNVWNDLGLRMDNLAAGERSSMELSRRISDRQLKIPRNRPRHTTMVEGRYRQNRIGPFTVSVLGPTEDAVEDLRAEWREWLTKNKKAMRDLQAKMLEDEEEMGTLASTAVANPLLESALGEGSITEPNLASLTLRVTADGKTLLLTGDGSSEDVLKGLEANRRVGVGKPIHFDALKVQHHGALANVTEEFVRRVTADHYIFCGNGAHHNPEAEVVERMALARLGTEDDDPIGPPQPFKFWFTSSSETPDLTDPRVKHMGEIEMLVKHIASQHAPNQFDFEFLKEGHFEIDL